MIFRNIQKGADTYYFEKELIEIFDFIKLNKNIFIVIDWLEYDETFEHL